MSIHSLNTPGGGKSLGFGGEDTPTRLDFHRPLAHLTWLA